MSDSIREINDFFEEKSTLGDDGKLHVKGSDFRELNRQLNEKNQAGRDLLSSSLEFLGKNDRMPNDSEREAIIKQGQNQPSTRLDNNIKENTMSDMNESTLNDKFRWDKDNNLNYANGVKFNFKIKPSPYFSLISEKNKTGFDVEINGDIDIAKKLVENAIKHFEQNRDIDLKQPDNQLELFSKINMSSYIKLSETLQRQDQSHNQPSTRRDNTIKENSMSDENASIQNVEQQLSSSEVVFWDAIHKRDKITEGLKNGTLSCLPRADGFADTQPAFNIMTGKVYHGDNLLYLKQHQQQHGFPTGEYITAYQVGKANFNEPDIFVKPGEKSVTIHFSEFNDDTEKYENKSVSLFNIAQVSNPQALKDWVIYQEQNKIDRMSSQFSESYKPPEPKQREPGPVIVCKSTEPEKYLGQYLAAVSMGGKFQASPEQAKEFSQKMETALYEKRENGHPNPFQLSKISIAASQHCVSFMKELKAEKRNEEQKQEQKQEQKHSMHL